MSIFSKIGRTMNKLPGMSTMTKPVSSLMQKTPGMRGAPAALGMMPQNKPGGIGPSPQMGMTAGVMQPPPTDVTPMPDVPMGDQAQGMMGPQFGPNSGSAFNAPSQGMNQPQMSGLAGRLAGRFGQQGMKPMNKMGRMGGFKPQY